MKKTPKKKETGAVLLGIPSLYACASKVKVPHVGADTRQLRQTTKDLRTLTKYFFRNTPKFKQEVANDYLRVIALDLQFSDDVTLERAPHTTSYSDKGFWEALDISDIVPRQISVKNDEYAGRYNQHGTDTRHLPCHLKHKKLPPIKKSAETPTDSITTTSNSEPEKDENSHKKESDGVFLTQVHPEEVKLSPYEDTWDKYVLSSMSEQTARWIVSKCKKPPRKKQLKDIVEGHFGTKNEKIVRLFDDEEREDDGGDENASGQKGLKWKKAGKTILDELRVVRKFNDKPTDPYSDNNAASFYRLPAGEKKARKDADNVELGAVNKTAYDIRVTPYCPPPPPTLKDFLPAAVGDKIHETNNIFEREWLTGAKQLYKKNEPGLLLMDTHTKYKKVLQSVAPQEPDEWYKLKYENRTQEEAEIHKQEKGLQRWSALPQPADHDIMVCKTPEMPVVQGTADFESKASSILSADLSRRKEIKTNSTLLAIAEEWRTRWRLDSNYTDATPDDLLRDMADLHPHIRLRAVVTCARAASHRPPQQPGITLSTEDTNKEELPEKVFCGLRALLDDEHSQVQRAAAIALYTLEHPEEQAEAVLRKTLQEERSIDRWTAAQCLGYFGEADSQVVGEILSQLLHSEDAILHERASFLLSKLSSVSMVVNSMVGEQLNSSSWRHRIMACKLLPKLNRPINQDLKNKLISLMWRDIHSAVRQVAAQTLGKTGHGREVHDQLKDKIVNGNERSRTEAVSKIGQLGIMTAKLLEPFLNSFEDEYVSVRQECCIACKNLKLPDENIIERLVHTAKYDAVWTVKALAIQAIASFGIVTYEIRECFLWAFRFESEPGVRAEACAALRKLKMADEDIIQVLQDRHLVEEDAAVQREICRTLENLHQDTQDDMDMVLKVKEEVRKLCTKENICERIITKDEQEIREENIKRLLYLEPSFDEGHAKLDKTAQPSKLQVLAPIAQTLSSFLVKQHETTLTAEEKQKVAEEKDRSKWWNQREDQLSTFNNLMTKYNLESHSDQPLAPKKKEKQKKKKEEEIETEIYTEMSDARDHWKSVYNQIKKNDYDGSQYLSREKESEEIDNKIDEENHKHNLETDTIATSTEMTIDIPETTTMGSHSQRTADGISDATNTAPNSKLTTPRTRRKRSKQYRPLAPHQQVHNAIGIMMETAGVTLERAPAEPETLLTGRHFRLKNGGILAPKSAATRPKSAPKMALSERPVEAELRRQTTLAELVHKRKDSTDFCIGWDSRDK